MRYTNRHFTYLLTYPTFQTSQWEGRSDPVRGKFPGSPLQVSPWLRCVIVCRLKRKNAIALSCGSGNADCLQNVSRLFNASLHPHKYIDQQRWNKLKGREGERPSRFRCKGTRIGLCPPTFQWLPVVRLKFGVN